MFGSDFGNLAVRGLVEITLPEPVSYLPQTLGWLIVLLVVLALAAWWGYRRYRHWRANRYRTVALRRLDAIERAVRQPDTRARGLAQLPLLLKETALYRYPRHEVAQLSGEPWLAFLDARYGGTGFSRGAGRILPDIAYQPDTALETITDARSAKLIALIRIWIRSHHADV
jgi:hypothetical protein